MSMKQTLKTLTLRQKLTFLPLQDRLRRITVLTEISRVPPRHIHILFPQTTFQFIRSEYITAAVIYCKITTSLETASHILSTKYDAETTTEA